MDEPEREPPHAGKRLTREDVLRLMEEHRLKEEQRIEELRLIEDEGIMEEDREPKALDLRHANLQRADLSDLDLHGADLTEANLEAANLRSANLQGAELSSANLQEAILVDANLQRANLSLANLQEARLQRADLRGADLWYANLQKAHLFEANLQEARLVNANLQGADLFAANLQEAALFWAELQDADLGQADLRRARLAHASLRDANLEGADWGDYLLGEEIDGKLVPASSVYRALKQWHTDAGMYDIAGEFHYREMEARRKLAWRGDPDSEQARRLPNALGLYLSRWLYGHGERPERVIGWAAAVVFGLAVVHWAFGTVAGDFLDALYYSAVSFTALGYGGWAPEPQGWAGRFLGASESFLGVFMIALFLVTFTRKMTR